MSDIKCSDKQYVKDDSTCGECSSECNNKSDNCKLENKEVVCQSCKQGFSGSNC